MTIAGSQHMARHSPLTDEESAARRKLGQVPGPTPLPANWTAAVLPSPFGDATPPMADYDQFVVAHIDYSYSGDTQAMQVGFYLLENLTYYRFVFLNTASGGEWYWLTALPGGPNTNSFGPFATSLVVPSPAFLT